MDRPDLLKIPKNNQFYIPSQNIRLRFSETVYHLDYIELLIRNYSLNKLFASGPDILCSVLSEENNELKLKTYKVYYKLIY